MQCNLPSFTAALALFFSFCGKAEAGAGEYLVPGLNFQLSSYSAILSPLPAFQPWNSAANIVDGSTASDAGVIVELAMHPGGVHWDFDFYTPSALTGVDLWTAAGAWPGNELKDFTVTLFEADATLGTESFTAASMSGWQTFQLASAYSNVTSLRFHVHSSYGDPMVMSVNEIRFSTVPEPGAMVFAGIAGVAFFLSRFRTRG